MPPSVPESRFERLIRALERVTKTDMRYLVSGGFWLTLDEVAGGLVALGLSIAFAHYLPKDVYGTYRYFIALYWTLTAFTMTGLPAAISRAVARGYEGTFRASFVWSVRWALPLSAVALAASTYYLIHGNTDLGFGLIVIAILGPLMQSAYLWGAYCVGKKQFKALALWGIFFFLFPACTVLATMYFIKNPVALLAGYLGGTVIAGFTIAWLILKRTRPNRDIDAEFKTLGWHFSAMNLLNTISQQVDKLVVFHYLGAVELAVYSLATALPEQIKNTLGGVSTLALPKFIERPFREIQKNFWNRLWSYTAMLALLAVVYIFIAPFAFDILFPAYHEAIWFSQLYALSLIPIGNTLPVTVLQAHKANRELYILNVLSPVFQILTLIFLTAAYGLLGTVIARIAGRVFNFITNGILLRVYARRERAGRVS
jgi:O-antigen/teichoic acid export membrane protein